MSLDLKHLRIVVAAAECGSFSSAALRLNTEISAVSRAVRDVEDMLGVAVFERLPRGVRLTPAGEIYVISARDILTRVAAAEQRARAVGGNGAGALSLGLVWPTFCWRVNQLLARFAAECPGVMLNVVEVEPDALLARVRSGELHVAIMAAEPAAYRSLRPHPDLESRFLWFEQLAVAVPESESASSFKWTDLADRWLLCRPEHDWRRVAAHVERLGGPTLHFLEHEVSGEGLLALTGAGLGWALVPGSMAGARVVNAKLVAVDEESATFQAEAVWLGRNPHPMLDRFLEIALDFSGPEPSDAPSRSPDRSP